MAWILGGRRRTHCIPGRVVHCSCCPLSILVSFAEVAFLFFLTTYLLGDGGIADAFSDAANDGDGLGCISNIGSGCLLADMTHAGEC